MEISFNTLVVFFDFKYSRNLSLVEFFNFNNFPTTHVRDVKEFWNKVAKAQEYDFDYILTVEVDSDHIPEDFINLFNKIDNAEIVIGKRQGNSWASKLFNSAYANFNLYQDWLSPIRLYRIETLLALSKFNYSEDVERFQFETLAKATELGSSVAEVAIKYPLSKPSLSIKELFQLWYSLFYYQKTPTYNESSLY